MSIRDVVPPNELWAYARAIENEYATEARKIMERLGGPADMVPRGATNAHHSTLSDPESASEIEVRNVASRLVDRLRDKDERHNS